MTTAISIENVSKQYRLGQVGTGTIAHDLNRWWARVRGKEDPFATVGQVNDRTVASTKHKAPSTRNSEATDYVWALKDINLQVAQGQILGIIGRNGAGKSTLLKLLSRVTAPTTGRIRVRGRMASLLEVGTGFHPELTGRENIYLNGAILGMTRAEIRSRFDEIVDFSGCAKYIDTPVKRYSSGMYVRLAFAVAAHLEPEILIVDEVLAVGDADFQSKCIGKMQDVSERGGRTILFVSHNMQAVQSLCSKTAIVNNGRIEKIGQSREMVQEYLAKTGQEPNLTISDWSDRITNGVCRIVNVRLIDSTGNKRTFATFGEPLIIEIDTLAHGTVKEPVVGLIISTLSGEPLLDLRSTQNGGSFDSIDEDTTASVTLEKVTLYPGEYLLSPWIVDRSSREDVDWVKNCTRLRVIPSPGEHGPLDSEWGRVFVTNQWKIGPMKKQADPI